MTHPIEKKTNDLRLSDPDLNLSTSKPETQPKPIPPKAILSGDKDTLDFLKNENTLESLRLAAKGVPNSLESLRAFEATNVPETFSFKDLLGPKVFPAALKGLQSPVGKFAIRTGLETALGVAVAGPIGGSTALTRSVGRGILLRSGERIARGVVRAAPNVLRVGAGEATGSLLAETFDPTGGEFDLAAATKRAAVTGAFGGTAELLVPGFSDAFTYLRNGGYALVDGTRPVVDKLLTEGAQVASPGFFSKSRFIQVMDNIGSGSFFGGGKLDVAKRGGAELFDDEVNAFMSTFQTFAKGTIEVEKLAKDLILGGADAFRLVAKKKYGVIDEIVGGGFHVDLNPLIKQLEEMASEFGGDGANKILKEIERVRGLGAVTDINTVNFKTAADIRSKLLGLSRDGDSIFANQVAAFGKQTSPTVFKAMEEAFQAVSKEGLISVELTETLFKRWTSANAFWKEGVATFNTDLMARLAGDTPSAIIRSVSNSPGQMRIVRNTIEGITKKVALETGEELTGKQVWKQVQGQLLAEESIKAAGRGGVAEDLVDGAKMVRQLGRKKELMVEAFGEKGFENLLKTFEAVAFAQGKGAQKGLPGKIFIQFAQATALATIPVAAASVVFGIGAPVGAGSLAGAAFVLLGPARSAALFTDPRFTKWLLRGTDETITATKRIRALVQLAALAQREGFIVANTSQAETAEQGKQQFMPLPAYIRGPGREQR